MYFYNKQHLGTRPRLTEGHFSERERFIISYDSANKQIQCYAIMHKSNQFSGEIRINENTIAK